MREFFQEVNWLFPWENRQETVMDSRFLPVNSCSGNLATGFKLPEKDVRRARVRINPWVRDPSGNSVVPAGSSRSGDGGNEIVKAFGEKGRSGDSASLQAAT
jgi:hypothetical protein